LTDFGLSKEGVTEVSSGAYSFCGTPEYIAPEILDRRGHGTAVDWWSFGTLLYEMIVGLPPFYSSDRQKLYQKIRSADLKFPSSMHETARDILTGLLQRDPNRRLGSGPDDAIPIKMHPFFADIDWPR
jgi:serine/threonine protein kinase